MKPASVAFLAMALLSAALAACSLSAPAATVTVDAGKRFQTIEGWEATAKMWEFDKPADRFDGSWLPLREPILKALIEQAGVTRLRLEIRSGAENPVDYWSRFRSGKTGYLGFKAHFYEKINDNDDPAVLNPTGVQFSELDFRVETLIIPAMQIAARLGKPMSFTLCYVDFGWTERKGTLSHANNPEEYAELIVATYAHLKEKYGLTPAALEIVLEPDNSDDWRGRQIGEAMVAVSRRLERQGIRDAGIIAPSVSVGRRAPDYVAGLTSVPGAAERLSVLSYHRYGGILPDETLAQIVAGAQRFGARTAMLEYTHASVNDLLDDLTIGNVSSWQKYGIVMLDRGGKSAPGNMLVATGVGSAKPQIGLLPSSAAMAQIFRSAPPGSVRIGTATSGSGVRAVAFHRPDGRITVTIKPEEGVVRETWRKVRKRLDMLPLLPAGTGEWVGIPGLEPGHYRVERMTAATGENAVRCRIDVKEGVSAQVHLGEGDIATLTGGAAGDPWCAAEIARS